MNYEYWQKELASLLQNLSPDEAKEIIDYYKEIYDDKKDAGLSDDEILAEFGSPSECVARMRESGFVMTSEDNDNEAKELLICNDEQQITQQVAQQNTHQHTQQNDNAGNEQTIDAPSWEFGKGTATQTEQGDDKKTSASNVLLGILMVLATVFVVIWVFISLYAATFSVIVSAGAGVLGAVGSLLNGFSGGFMPWLATAGAYLVETGVCAILGLYLCKLCKFLTVWYFGLLKKTLSKKEESK